MEEPVVEHSFKQTEPEVTTAAPSSTGTHPGRIRTRNPVRTLDGAAFPFSYIPILFMKFKENISLARYSNYRIGGPARFFFEAKNEREVVWAVREAKRLRVPVFVLAGGTNLLIDDKGFDGLVLRPMMKTLRGTGKANVEAGAGVSMAHLLKFAAAQSRAGLEWAGGLPGTVGGAVRGNAGCFGGEIKDCVASVRSLDMRTMKILTRSAAQCAFRYRDSIFKRNEKRKGGGEIILSITFALRKGDPRAIMRTAREKIAYRRERQPLEYPNIGSMFKNVPLEALLEKKSARYRAALAAGELVYRGARFSVKTDPFPVIAAAKLIGESGLRGVSMGGAMISPKHTNFIVNALGAGSWDVAVLMLLAKEVVQRKFGIRLEEEVQVI